MGEISLNNFRYTVIYFEDRSTGRYTFNLLEKGGPIISAKSIEEGKDKMTEAIKVAAAVRNLAYFNDVSFINRVYSANTRGTNVEDSIKYEELTLA